MKFTSVADVEEALEPLVAMVAATTGRDITTERTFVLAEQVGNPQEQLRVVHIAGTSGKTSTSYYIAGLLAAAGAKVGLTVSPHIASITERVQINGRPLPEEAFCRYMSEFLPHILEGLEDDLPSYFEVMMVFALWVFEREGVDYAVVETGLGGLHDASNICRRADKLCVITDIGLDHTYILGDTVPQIAAQKAGIIAPQNHVVLYEQDAAIMRVVREQADIQHATMTVVDPPEYADYQDRNFGLALAAYAQLVARDGLAVVSDNTLQAVRQLQVPGRLETVEHRGVQIVCDGAHNEQKMYALVQTLGVRYPGQKWAIVLAMKQSKDYEAVVRLLASIASRAVATQFRLSQDTPIVSIAPATLAAECQKYNVPCAIRDSVGEAVDLLIDEHESHILVTGSLYMLAEVQ